jgi:hypothetical protein
MDTLPYWYTPLARVFNIPLGDVAQRAERWIVDELGMGEDDWMADVRELRDERTAERMSHRQGAIPPLESLHLYLEYHAMMLAAGELVDVGTPVLVSRDEDAGDPWHDWLSLHLPGSRRAWLADLCGPIPLEPVLFGHMAAIDDWQDAKAADFEQVLGCTGGTLPDAVLVAGYANVHRPGGHGTDSVQSALVNPAYAPALQRALQASSNPIDWRLPDEGDHENEFREGRYELRGWLAEEPTWWRRDGSMDTSDPYAEGMSWTGVLPGNEFRRLVGCAADTRSARLADGHSRPIAWSEQWADEERGTSYRTREVQSSGHRTLVHKSALLKYLEAVGMQLIVEVQIGRHRDQRGGSGSWRTPTSRLFRLDEHGRVHALEQPGDAAR